MSSEREDESEKDQESTSSEEDNVWSIEKIFNLDMTSCPMLELQHAIAYNSAINSVKEAFYEAYEVAFNELHQVHLRANITGTSQHSSDLEKTLPNPFKEMEVVLRDLANAAQKTYPQIDKDTMSGLFLKEEEHSAAAGAVGGAGGGSIVASTIMVNTNHDTPSLSTCTDMAFRNFLNAVTVLHNSNVPCHIHQWMSNTEVRSYFYWNMFSNGLVKSESQFDSILKSPSRFITMGEAYMRVISLPVGERSIADTVRTKLKFSINDVLSEKESRETIAAFSKFGDENAEVVKNITGADQSQLVKALIETNLQGAQSDAQRYLFSYLKDLPAIKKPKTIKSAFQKLLEKLMTTKASCKEAYAVGYRFAEQYPTSTTEADPLNDDKSNRQRTLLAERKRKRGGEMGSSSHAPTDDKSPQKMKQFCRGCGIEGHKQESCSKASLKFHNAGPMDYDKSPAWAEVLKEFPRILEVLPHSRPRIPSSLHLKELALLTGQVVSKRDK